MKPPMNGARSGPEKTVIEKTVIARPLVRLSNMSEKTAATTAKGQAPKRPPKKRHSKTVCRSLAVATATWKIEKPNMESTRGKRRPLNSERGAQRMGPVANPKTYNESPRVPTSDDTWKYWATASVAAEKILLVNADTSVVKPSIVAVSNLSRTGQLRFSEPVKFRGRRTSS